MEHQAVRDKRSHKLVFLTHCCLNQNAKVRGIARFPGAIEPLVKLILERGIGIYQMPCPEMAYLGNMRWSHVKDQYDNPMFRRHCDAIVEGIVDQVENYIQCGYTIAGFIMMDGSPVCGLNRTHRPKQKDTLWGGMVWYVPESDYAPDTGVFCGILQKRLRERGFQDIPFAASPEFDEAGSLDASLEKIEELFQT